MTKVIRIGTRESQLAVWQANQVKDLLATQNIPAELVYIRSEGDIDLKTPLYEMGVQGIFTRSLDSALLNDRIDLAVHSMKDVPVMLPPGISQAAVMKRASYKDLLVHKGNTAFLDDNRSAALVATSSIRRIAQWKHRYPHHQVENLRGNVNTRLKKVAESNWQGAIFAAAGLERIGLRPEHSLELDWMLPAPAQGAIMVVCRTGDETLLQACTAFNDEATATCTSIERDFLRALLGGCSTPISALAEVKDGAVFFQGNILATDGSAKAGIEETIPFNQTENAGAILATALLANGGQAIADAIRPSQKQ
ncbi:MAG: hydroxymethylbilane synthase [Candidatus Pseudobacter hemicellulosilyticus]|uniref:Hydroxymethylbilane synthase n=1 Tax=Candidatus Pseudobacter hemicellulosilyticus TaxID=3121375 RepID=A0AAJ5WV31_9BACT|nr:MAG: hydroxymethylbilane synthase [Pseudobacter sp.]